MLGGLFQNGSVTQANFINMLNIILVIVPHPLVGQRPLTIKARSEQTISQSSQPLTPRDYDIYAPEAKRRKKRRLIWIASIQLSNEPFVPSYSVSGHEADFTQGVRAKDGKVCLHRDH